MTDNLTYVLYAKKSHDRVDYIRYTPYFIFVLVTIASHERSLEFLVYTCTRAPARSRLLQKRAI